MEKTDAAVATVADKLGDKALQYLSSFEELAKQYSPDVVDAGLTVIRINALGDIIVGLVGIAVAFVVWKIFKRVRAERGKEYFHRNEAICIIGGAISFFGGIASFVMILFGLFNIWVYVALFDPKLYIAYKIFGKLF